MPRSLTSASLRIPRRRIFKLFQNFHFYNQQSQPPEIEITKYPQLQIRPYIPPVHPHAVTMASFVTPELFAVWSDYDGLLHKPDGPNFGYFKPLKRQTISEIKLKEIIREARRKNPPGVRVAGLSADNMAHVAGYLGFQNTAILTAWFEDDDQLPSILKKWQTHKRTAFGCTIRSGSKISEKNFDAGALFKFIKSLTPQQASLVTGDKFPITHTMLGVKATSDDPGFFCYLNAMHKVIITYPAHFPDDEPVAPKELHSPENWYRALITLRTYWSIHKDYKPRTRGLTKKDALVPIYINMSSTDEEDDDDGIGKYAVYKQHEYFDMFNLESYGIAGDYSEADEAIEAENIRELDVLHRNWNQTGDISKEATLRELQGDKKSRPPIRPEDLTMWIKNLKEHMDQFIVKEKPVKGPMKESASVNPLIKQTMDFTDVMDSVEGLTIAEKQELEDGRNKFFDLLEKMASASAEPDSFIECCERFNIDYSDMENLRIPGTLLKAFPHQIIGKSTFRAF